MLGSMLEKKKIKKIKRIMSQNIKVKRVVMITTTRKEDRLLKETLYQILLNTFYVMLF